MSCRKYLLHDIISVEICQKGQREGKIMGNIFDILGPVMVGPSSSHTAGAARIGLPDNFSEDSRKK